MSMSTLTSPPTLHRHMDESATRTQDSAWKPIYTIAGAAALLSIACIVVAIVVFIVSPPPTAVSDWFALFHRSGILGLLDLDLMMLVSYALMGVIYLALYGALGRFNRPFMLLALISGFVSIATYFASNPAFNMLLLSDKYASATTAAEQSQLLAAGQATLASWNGSAYNMSYVLGAVPMLILAIIMLRSAVFSRATAYVGIVLSVMMIVPADAGPVGLVVAFLSLVPTAIWLILIARRLFELGSASLGTHAPIKSTYSLEVRLSREDR